MYSDSSNGTGQPTTPHKFSPRGVMHTRNPGPGYPDIGAGNILPAERFDDPGQASAAGSLVDLEYAQTTSTSTKPVVTETEILPQRIPGRWNREGPVYTNRGKFTHKRFDGPPGRGAPITGAALHFLSRRQLSMVINPDLDLEPTAEDDAESFFLVLVYAVIRSLACSDRMLHITRAQGLDEDTVRSRKQQLLEFFGQHWGAKTVDEIHQSRTTGSFLNSLLTDAPALAAGTVGEWFLDPGQLLVSDPLLNSVLSKCASKFDYAASITRKRDRLGDMLSPKSEKEPPYSTLTARQLFTHDELIELLKEAIAQLPAWTARLKASEDLEAQKEAKEAKKIMHSDLSTV